MFDMFENFAKENEEAYKKRNEESNLTQDTEIYSPPSSKGPIYVISAGGSLFFHEKPLTSKIAKFSETINRLRHEGHRFIIVPGGGKVTRNYVAAIKSFGADHFRQDHLGILLTKANALVFIQALDNSHREILSEPKQALEVLDQGKIPVFGGLFPFFTTDAVTALISEAVGGIFVNLTDVDGIYSQDPKKNPHAKFFETISYEKLISLIKLAESKPAQNIVLDLPCCLILNRSKIKGVVLNGENLDNFEAMIRGDEYRGTVIADDPNKSEIEDQVEEVE